MILNMRRIRYDKVHERLVLRCTKCSGCFALSEQLRFAADSRFVRCLNRPMFCEEEILEMLWEGIEEPTEDDDQAEWDRWKLKVAILQLHAMEHDWRHLKRNIEDGVA